MEGIRVFGTGSVIGIQVPGDPEPWVITPNIYQQYPLPILVDIIAEKANLDKTGRMRLANQLIEQAKQLWGFEPLLRSPS